MADETLVTLTDPDPGAGDEVSDLRWALLQAVAGGASRVVVDVSQVRRLSSATLAALLLVHRRCRARGGGIVVRGGTRATLDLLRRNSLDRVFHIEEPRHHRSLRDDSGGQVDHEAAR